MSTKCCDKMDEEPKSFGNDRVKLSIPYAIAGSWTLMPCRHYYSAIAMEAKGGIDNVREDKRIRP